MQTRSFQLMRRDKSCEPVRRRWWAPDTSTIRKSSAADRMTVSLVQRQEAADRQSNGWRRYAKLQSDSWQHHLSRIVREKKGSILYAFLETKWLFVNTKNVSPSHLKNILFPKKLVGLEIALLEEKNSCY